MMTRDFQDNPPDYLLHPPPSSYIPLHYSESYHHHHTTEDPNRHHRILHHNSNHGSSSFSRRHTNTQMCIPQASSNEATPKHPNISVLKTQALSTSTEDTRFPFDSFQSKRTAKQDDNISTTSLPTTPTATVHDTQPGQWSRGMPLQEEITAGFVSVVTSEQQHLMSSGSSSASSVCKDEARSVGSSSSKQRKRKERRDSLSDEHDKKLSRSSGSLVDNLSSNSPHKDTGCNLPIKRSNSHRTKNQTCQTNTDYTTNIPTLDPKCQTGLSKKSAVLPKLPLTTFARESKNDDKKQELTEPNSIDSNSQQHPILHHVLQEQNHELTSPHRAYQINEMFDHHDLPLSVSCIEVESSLPVAAIADSSIQLKNREERCDSLKENKITVPDAHDVIHLRGILCAKPDSFSVVESTTDEQSVIPDCTADICHRVTSEAIQIPQFVAKRIENGEFLNDHENTAIIDEQYHGSSTAAKQVHSNDMKDGSTNDHQKVKSMPDEQDDTLSLYSSSPISCASSSSETSEDEDENQKLQHQQRRKDLFELRKKLERSTDIDNSNEDDSREKTNQEESKLKCTADTKSVGNVITRKIKESLTPNEETKDGSGESECEAQKSRNEHTSSKISNDSAGIGDRLRHLSERSWSSTSSGELSSFSSCQDSRLSSTSAFQQYSPVSWMPHLTLSIRESMSSQSSEGTSDGFDMMAAKACDADSQFVGTRHFGIINSKRHLDPSHMTRVTGDQDSPKRTKIKQLSRQLSSVRRKLEDLENEFETAPGGYKLSQFEKHKYKPMRKLLSDQSKLKRQIRNCRESSFGDVDDDVTTLKTQLSNIDHSSSVCNQFSTDQPISAMPRSLPRRSSWSGDREAMLSIDTNDNNVPPSLSSASLSIDCPATLPVSSSLNSSSSPQQLLSSSPGGSSVTSTSSGNSGSSSLGGFSSSGESCMSIGDASLGSSEIYDAEEENRPELGNSDNEDNNSDISQNLASLLNKDVEVDMKGKISAPKIEVISVGNKSTSVTDVTDNRSDTTLKNNNDSTNRNLESMRNSLIDVEQRLKAQRVVAGRPYDLEAMTPEQLLQEKVDLQSALLQFEHLFGHPESNEEKVLVKDVYDRYRSVKRHVRRSSSIRSKDPLELETIPEDLEIPLTLASPQHRINIETHASSRCVDINILVEGSEHTRELRSMDGIPVSSDPKNSKSYDSSISAATIHAVEANLHSMSRYELLQVQRRTREEKKLYRRAIKEKEERLLAQTGRRRMPKGERDSGDATYGLYKLAKAKLKLIEALLSKPGPLLC